MQWEIYVSSVELETWCSRSPNRERARLLARAYNYIGQDEGDRIERRREFDGQNKLFETSNVPGAWMKIFDQQIRTISIVY